MKQCDAMTRWINSTRCTTDAFVAALSGIFEHSPWVAEAALAKRPFASIDAASRRHGDRIVDHGRRSAATCVDQRPPGACRQGCCARRTHARVHARAERRGPRSCTQEEFDRLQALNAAYREKFGFPFILAVRGFDRHGIIANFEARLNHSRDVELRESLSRSTG